MSVDEYFGEQTLSLARAARRLSFAKEDMAIKHLQEMEIYREAVRSEAEENHSLPYRAQQAVALASAVRETLAAEKAYADRRAEKAALLLKARRDEADEVAGKLAKADMQLSALTRDMHRQNLGRDWAAGRDLYRFRPRERHQERWPYANALDDESGSESDDSGLESFYEAPDGHGSDDNASDL
jgi:predicted phage gp36 major capsid-like protein